MGLPLWYQNRRELGEGPIQPASGGAGRAPRRDQKSALAFFRVSWQHVQPMSSGDGQGKAGFTAPDKDMALLAKHRVAFDVECIWKSVILSISDDKIMMQVLERAYGFC